MDQDRRSRRLCHHLTAGSVIAPRSPEPLSEVSRILRCGRWSGSCGSCESEETDEYANSVVERIDERVVLLHVGMHKTGTTAFQARCRDVAQQMEERGLLYPRAGTGEQGRGHFRFALGHCLFAAEMIGPSPWSPTTGASAEVLTEIRESTCDRVLLSAEDLSLAWHRDADLHRLRSAIEDLGYSAHVLIARRESESFVPSMYGQVVRGGSGMSREAFYQEARDHGRVVVPARIGEPSKTYCTDPDRLVAAFQENFGGDRVHVIDYVSSDMIDQMVTSQAWFFGDEAALFAAVRPFNESDSPQVREFLEDRLAAVQSSVGWRATAWARSPAVHAVRDRLRRVLRRS